MPSDARRPKWGHLQPMYQLYQGWKDRPLDRLSRIAIGDQTRSRLCQRYDHSAKPVVEIGGPPLPLAGGRQWLGGAVGRQIGRPWGGFAGSQLCPVHLIQLHCDPRCDPKWCW